MSKKIIRLVEIRGRVQGVGFRAWTQYTAERHGLEGWVRNRRDGSVEALFAGEERILRAMMDLCRQGPPAARVDAIEQRDASPEELDLRGGTHFAQLPTL